MCVAQQVVPGETVLSTGNQEKGRYFMFGWFRVGFGGVWNHGARAIERGLACDGARWYIYIHNDTLEQRFSNTSLGF